VAGGSASQRRAEGNDAGSRNSPKHPGGGRGARAEISTSPAESNGPRAAPGGRKRRKRAKGGQRARGRRLGGGERWTPGQDEEGRTDRRQEGK